MKNMTTETATTTRARLRCACGRVRRKTSELCQACIDAADALARSKEPPCMWAREWRRASYLCAFIDGNAVIAKRVNGEIDTTDIRTTPINGGRWSALVNLADWTPVTSAAMTLRLSQIHRDCYCSSFPDTGCDFCNGTRLPDGAS